MPKQLKCKTGGMGINLIYHHGRQAQSLLTISNRGQNTKIKQIAYFPGKLVLFQRRLSNASSLLEDKGI